MEVCYMILTVEFSVCIIYRSFTVFQKIIWLQENLTIIEVLKPLNINCWMRIFRSDRLF